MENPELNNSSCCKIEIGKSYRLFHVYGILRGETENENRLYGFSTS